MLDDADDATARSLPALAVTEGGGDLALPPAEREAPASVPEREPIHFDVVPSAPQERGRSGVLLLLAALAAVLVLAIAWPFAGPLLVAAVLAGALNPLCDRLCARIRNRRAIASAMVTASVALTLLIPVVLLAVPLAREALDAVEYVRETLGSEGMTGLIDDSPEPLRSAARAVVHSLPRGEAQLKEVIGRETGAAAHALSGAVIATSGLLIRVALMFVALYFLLLDGRRFVDWITDVAPLRNAHVRELLADFRNVSVAVLWASTASAAIQAAVAAIGFLIARTPRPLFLTALTFVAAFIPAVGAGTAVVGAALVLYFNERTSAAIFLALWGVLVVAFVDNLVKPYLMKDRMEVHGGVLFFALLGGLALFGPVGLLAGPLIVAFFLAVVRLCRREYGSDVPNNAEPTPSPP